MKKKKRVERKLMEIEGNNKNVTRAAAAAIVEDSRMCIVCKFYVRVTIFAYIHTPDTKYPFLAWCRFQIYTPSIDFKKGSSSCGRRRHHHHHHHHAPTTYGRSHRTLLSRRRWRRRVRLQCATGGSFWRLYFSCSSAHSAILCGLLSRVETHCFLNILLSLPFSIICGIWFACFFFFFLVAINFFRHGTRAAFDNIIDEKAERTTSTASGDTNTENKVIMIRYASMPVCRSVQKSKPNLSRHFIFVEDMRHRAYLHSVRSVDFNLLNGEWCGFA